MARHLGVDYDASFSAPPTTNEERVVYALQCGLSLIMDYAYPDQWALISQDGRLSKRDCRKAARYVQEALPRPEGQEGIGWAAQGYARAMADLWRRAADPTTRTGSEVPEEDRAGLLVSAGFSESVAELLAHDFAVEDPHAVLPEMASAEAHRLYDPENPDAMTDLRDYAARAGVTMQSLALAMGPEFPAYDEILIGPVMSLNLAFDYQTNVNWVVVAEYWSNLLKPDCVGYEEMTHRVAAKAASGFPGT